MALAPLASAQAWPAAHGALDNHREAASAIDAGNVATLQPAWRVAARGSVTGTPVHDGQTAYFADWDGHVRAVRLVDGGAVWQTDLDARVDASLAIAGPRLLVPDATGNLTALDRATGQRLWSTWIEPVRGTHLWGSPAVVGDRVVIGMASEQTDLAYAGAQDFRGGVACIDAATGAILWQTFFQAEDAHGVSVWSTPAVDEARGLLFVGSGNAYGAPSGDLSDSIVALRLDEGGVAWSYQATSGDTFDARGSPGPDADFGASPILFESGGRALVGDGDKAGRFFALDRDTGALVWNATVDFVAPGATPAEKEGFLGTGAFWNGTLFLPTTARSMVHALDAATGRVLWSRELNDEPKDYGDRMFGSTSVTNGVVLQGNAFGSLFALDARDGSVLANLSVGGDVQGGVSIANDTLLVPDAGGVLWDSYGNLTAYRLGARPIASPSPSASPLPEPSPPRVSASELPPIDVQDAPGAQKDSSRFIAAPGIALVIAALVAASGRARRPPPPGTGRR